MLRTLSIHNFILIEKATIELGPGLTVISGETGAGKSIIAQALMFLMGSKSDSSLLRHGADEAVVTGTFSAANGQLQQCERRLAKNGRSKVLIDGAAATVTELKVLMGSLVDIASQFDQQRLLDPSTHLDVIDEFMGSVILSSAKDPYTTAYTHYTQARATLTERQRQLSEARTQEEFLRFQWDELTKAKLQAGEEDELIAQRNRIRHQSQWQTKLQTLEELLSGNTAIAVPVRQLQIVLQGLLELDPRWQPMVELAQTIDGTLDDLSRHVARELAQRTEEPLDLDDIESRLFTLHQLLRKYKTDLPGLIEKRDQLKQQLLLLDLGDEGIQDLENDCAATAAVLQEAGKALSQKRRGAAKKLCTAIQKVLAEVAMPHATLHVQWQDLPVEAATPRGLDAVEFLISPNVGELLQPMAQIASGGELSRILLAIKCVVSGPFMVSLFTLFFDEVDTGIGGRVASQVGAVLQRLAHNGQVLCITHLPQVAVYGDTHLRVCKSEVRGRTVTHIEHLNPELRRTEIARMMAGATITPAALQHADELLAQGKKNG